MVNCLYIQSEIQSFTDTLFNPPAGSQGDGVRSAWEARFPDIKLNLTVDLSKYHDNRIDRAFYEQKHVVDVAVLQTLQDFPRWKQENRLLFYKSNTFMDLLGGEKDLDGAFLPVQISTVTRLLLCTSCLLIHLNHSLFRHILLRQQQAPQFVCSNLLCFINRSYVAWETNLDLSERRRCRRLSVFTHRLPLWS